MNFWANGFGQPLLAAANLLVVLLLLGCARPAWAAIRARPAAAAAALLLQALLWGVHAELGGGHLAGMTYHLLGVSLVGLMLGAPAAFCLGMLLLLPYTWLLHGIDNLAVVGLNALVLLLPPALVCWAVCRLSGRLPPNIFIYIFVNGFFAAAASMLVAGAAVVLCLQLAGVYAAEVLWQQAYPVFFLLAWGEAFLSGIFTAIFVALAPQLLITFDDARYLQAQRQIWKV